MTQEGHVTPRGSWSLTAQSPQWKFLPEADTQESPCDKDQLLSRWGAEGSRTAICFQGMWKARAVSWILWQIYPRKVMGQVRGGIQKIPGGLYYLSYSRSSELRPCREQRTQPPDLEWPRMKEGPVPFRRSSSFIRESTRGLPHSNTILPSWSAQCGL